MLKAIELVGAILLAGGPVFLTLIWRPALAAAPDGRGEALDLAVARLVRAGVPAGLLLVALGSFLDLLGLAADLAGSPLFSAATADKLAAVLFQSRLGPLVLLRVLLAAGTWSALRAARHWAAVMAGIGVLATFSLTGHAVTVPGAGVAADLVHLLAAAAWGGGLVYLAFLPWRELTGEGNLPVLHEAVKRFSLLGLAAVTAVVGTGLFMSARRLYGPTALFETRYGLDLLWKVGFLAGVLIIAKGNLSAIRSRLRRAAMEGVAEESLTRSLRRRVWAEVAGILLILAAAGHMSTQQPPVRVPVPVGPVIISDLRYSPPSVEIPRGKPVRLTVVNQDRVTHSFAVQRLPYEGLRGHVHDPAAASWDDLIIYVPPRSSRSGVFTALQSGSYRIFCALEDYAERGMAGTLVVK